MDEDQGKPRRRHIAREWYLQVAIKQFCRDALDMVPSDYQFFGFDSAQKATENQRARMVAKGSVVGCPDTLLCVRGHRNCWVELKWGAGKPSDDQSRLLDKLALMDQDVACVNSIESYRAFLAICGIPLRQNAALIAADLDLKVQARIAAAEQRVATPGRARKPGPRYLGGKRIAAMMNRG